MTVKTTLVKMVVAVLIYSIIINVLASMATKETTVRQVTFVNSLSNLPVVLELAFVNLLVFVEKPYKVLL